MLPNSQIYYYFKLIPKIWVCTHLVLNFVKSQEKFDKKILKLPDIVIMYHMLSSSTLPGKAETKFKLALFPLEICRLLFAIFYQIVIA